MKTYYVAGLPYSDELWHHGTKGMKWGQRLYQNPDGTLTALGKIHYGTKKALNAVGSSASKATKAVARHEIDKFKRKHPWTMSDQEIDADLKRLQKEKQIKDAYYAAKGKSVGQKFLGKAGDITFSALKNFGDSFGKTMGEKAVGRVLEKAGQSEDTLKAKQLKERSDVVQRKIELAKAKRGLARLKTESRIQNLKDEKEILTGRTAYLEAEKKLSDYKKSLETKKTKS